MLATLIADVCDMPLHGKVFHTRFDDLFGVKMKQKSSYLLPAPQALPQAGAGFFSSLSPAPQALPQAGAGFFSSFLSPAPQALPQAAGAEATTFITCCALWPKPNSLERFIVVFCKVRVNKKVIVCYRYVTAQDAVSSPVRLTMQR
jgi:hypothetical protein